MTLQQLRYVVEVAAQGSISRAAAALFIAQPSLSKAIAELERELGISIFSRSAQGVSLTEEGDRFLAYARQVVDQVDMLEAHYVGGAGPRRSLSISCPHEAHLARIFARTIGSVDEDAYEFILREVPASVVLEDVRQQRSELGIIYRSERNRERLETSIRTMGLHYAAFTRARPHILVGEGHPLAARESIDPEDLRSYPRVMLEWVSYTHGGVSGSLVPLESPSRTIRSTDRETQHQLALELDGYLLLLSIGTPLVRDGFRAIPLADARPIEVGLLTRPGIPLSPLAVGFRSRLGDLAEDIA